MQQSVFLFLGLTESNNSSVDEITFRNKLNLRLCLPRTDYDTRAVLRDEMYTLLRRLDKLPHPRTAIALQQSSQTTATPELLSLVSLRHSLPYNA